MQDQTSPRLTLSPIATFIRVSVVGISLAAGSAHAFTTIVNTNSDDQNDPKCSLRDAIVSMNQAQLTGGCGNGGGVFGTNDRILFYNASVLGGNTITLEQGQLTIASGKNILIEGAGVSELTISGNDETRVFNLSNASLTLNNTTVAAGRSNSSSGAGIRAVTTSSVTLNNVLLSGNTATFFGGGIDARGGSSVTLNNSRLEMNSAIYGGGISGNASSITLINSTASGNTARAGGTIYSNGSELTLNDSSISSSIVGRSGGGVYARSGRVTLNNSMINNNTATGTDLLGSGIGTRGSGGGIFSSESTITLNATTISGNSGAANGAGAFAYRSTITMSNSTVRSNSATGSGGGIYARFSSLIELTNSRLIDNRTSAEGGGMYIVSQPLQSIATITESSISGNSSALRGGGLTALDSVVTLNKSTVSKNLGAQGGALFVGSGADVTLNDSTVSGNSGYFLGGAIYARSTVKLNNSTVSDNTISTYSGGAPGTGVDIGSTTVTLNNSIVANTVGGPDCRSIEGTVLANSSNIIENEGNCASSARNIDPKLEPLADNGGRTQTHNLQAGSPAINTGSNASCTTFDQLGNRRTSIDGRCDVGAVEHISSSFFVIPIVGGKSVIFQL